MATLPKKLSEPNDNPLAYSTLGYGPPKIGKTSLFKGMKYFFMDGEKGTKAMRTYRRFVSDWDDVREYRDLLHSGGYRLYRGLVVDPVEKFYIFCMRYTCKKGKVEHPTDEEYGKGWERLRREFLSVMGDLAALPFGVAFLSHSQVSQIKTKNSDDSRISPKLSGMARHTIVPLVDTIAYIGNDPRDEDKRLIWLRGTSLIEAGTRMEESFKVPRKVIYYRGMNWADVMKKVTPLKRS